MEVNGTSETKPSLVFMGAQAGLHHIKTKCHAPKVTIEYSFYKAFY